MESSYACENNFKSGKEHCDFRIGRTILSRELQIEEVKALLNEKRTPLLSGFVSKRNKRTFSAHLTLDAKGKMGFEFAPRASAEEKTNGVTPRSRKG